MQTDGLYIPDISILGFTVLYLTQNLNLEVRTLLCAYTHTHTHTHTHTYIPIWGFPDSSVGKESAYKAGDPSWIPRLGRSAGEGIGYLLQYSRASLVTQLVKNLPAMWDVWVRSLGWEDPLEKGKATTPVFWPGEFHGLCSPCGRKESDTTEWLWLWLWLSVAGTLEFWASAGFQGVDN